MKIKRGKKQRKSGAHNNRGNVDKQSQKDALYYQEKFVQKIQKQKFLENKEKELARQPHCLVIHRGDVGKYVKGLESDLRNLVEPFTAKNLKILKRNNIKDFIVNGAILGVTNMMVLTSSDASLQLRMMRFSQGPTLTFKVKQYSLARHIISSQKRPVATDKLFKTSPLVVMNGFGDGAMKHLSLVQTFMQNMFPAINVDTIQLGNLKRCLIVSYDEESDEIQLRQYAIRVVASGLNKSVKKLMQAEKTMGKNIPNLSNYKDISDYFLNPGQLSDSEFEGDQQEVELPQEISEGRGCGLGQKSNVRLHEIGPRLTLELTKIEEGIDEGEVLYHKHHAKTPDELIKLRAHMDKKKQMKKRREQESEQRVIRRLTIVKEQQDADEAEVKAIRESAARRQAAATGQVEEVENQKEKDREIAMNRERDLKRANEEWETSGDYGGAKRGRYEDGRGRRGGFRGRDEESGEEGTAIVEASEDDLEIVEDSEEEMAIVEDSEEETAIVEDSEEETAIVEDSEEETDSAEKTEDVEASEIVADSEAVPGEIVAVSVEDPEIVEDSEEDEDAIKSIECKPLLGRLAVEMAKHAEMPPPDELKAFAEMCSEALVCMEHIKCDFLKNATVLIAKTCTGINLMAGPFGKCIEELRNSPPSLKKYPCARFLQTELGRPGNCQMYQDELECTKKLAADKCGQEAVDSMSANMEYIRGMMDCSQ
ncbi:unnamed protein product [Caenorhabditis sp. 36 PRJEB53466]|nr:unnamed protein product [Caenorhabditis sp. 36 PRJEB53466]